MDGSLLITSGTSSIFSSVSSDSGRADRGSSLTSSLPSWKHFVHSATVGYDGTLDPKVVASSS